MNGMEWEMPDRSISIVVSLWDSGCLPQVLMSEIAKVQAFKSWGEDADKTEGELRAQYLAQLRACYTAVVEARR